MAEFIAVIGSVEKYRDLSAEEKERIACRILSSKYMDLRCDWAFKHVMKNEAVLKLLLQDFISEDIDHVEDMSMEIDRTAEDDKNIIMDVLCHTADGRRFIVEMQRKKKASFKNRMFYYGASMIHGQLSRGGDYADLMPVYVICFMDFKLSHDIDQLVYRYSMREQQSGESFNSLLSICLCELPRLKATRIEGLNEIESWFYILENLHTFTGNSGDMGSRFEPLIEAAKMNPLPDKNKLQYIRAMVSESERLDIGKAYYEDGFAEGKAAGIAEGKVAGIAELWAKDLGVPPLEAMMRFYATDFYRLLEDESTKLWTNSPQQLYVLFREVA